MFWCLSAGNGHNEIDDFIAKSIPGACRLKWAQRKEGFHDQIDFGGLLADSGHNETNDFITKSFGGACWLTMDTTKSAIS